MANINLTYRCNLKCPYCFANEFVNKHEVDITTENFQKAVAFATSSGACRIGLIGGEPLVHPLFPIFLNSLINNNDVKGINLYTNGVYLDKYLELIKNPKVDILINCNSPQQIGKNNFERITSNISNLYIEKATSLTLGINLYDECTNYEYIFDLLRDFNQKGIRIAVTVPDFSCQTKISPIRYFKERKNMLKLFFKELRKIGVMPYYDCNAVPACIWNAEELRTLKEWINDTPNVSTNIINGATRCYPVIDILPDLKAIRCFGLSSISKVKIQDFKNIRDLEDFYINVIDNVATRICSSKQCITCYDHKIRKCMSGCIGFNSKYINDINRYIEESETRERE